MNTSMSSQERIQQKLTGIGGALLLYLVLQLLNILFFLGGVVTTGATVYDVSNAELSKALSNIQGIVLPFNIIATAFLVITLIFVMRCKQNAIRATVIILSVNIGMALVYGMLSTRVMLNIDSQYGITPALAGLLFSVMYNGCWILYFMRSHRVKLTMTR